MDQDTSPNVAEPLRVTDNRGKKRQEWVQESLLTDEQLDQLREQARNDDSDSPHDHSRKGVLTAFLVMCDYEGNVEATNQMDLIESLEISRPATFADMYSAAAHLQKDIAGQEQSMRVLASMQQQARLAMEQRNAAQVRQNLTGLNLR